MMKLVNKYKNLSIQTKTTIWFLIASFITRGISFLSAPLFTRLLTTEEYGVQSVFYSFQQVFLILATFELTGGAFVRGLIQFKNDRGRLRKATLLLSNVLTLTTFLVFLCVQTIVCKVTGVGILAFCLMFLYFVFYPAYYGYLMESRFDYKYKRVVFLVVLQALLTTVSSLLIVYFFKNTAEAKIITVLVVDIAICIPFYFFSKPFALKKTDFSRVKEMAGFSFKFQFPLLFHSLSYLILAQADRVMISELCGKSEAGIYSVAYTVAVLISVLQIALRDSLSPFRLKCMDSNDYSKIKQSSDVIFVLMALAIITYTLILPEPFTFVFPSDYKDGLNMVGPIIGSAFFMTVYSVFVDFEEYFKETKYVAYASLIAAALNVALNFVGLYYWTYEVCAYTTLITYFVLAVMHFVFAVHVLKKNHIKLSEVVDVPIMLVLGIAVFAFSLLSFLLNPFIIARYSFVAVVILLVIVFRKKLFVIFRRQQ